MPENCVPYKVFDLTVWDLMVYDRLPPHPFWDQVAKLIDFSFADMLCMPLYSALGQHPYPPSLKLKIHFAQRYLNFSDRQMEEAIIGNLFLKRFLGLPVDHLGFDHSTIALDRARMGGEMFNACFHHILEQARAMGLWGGKEDYWLIDSFYSKANVVVPHAYGLVQQCIHRLLKLLANKNPDGYQVLAEEMDIKAMQAPLPSQANKSEKLVAFSRLMVLAYGLLAWLEQKALTWQEPRDAEECKELQGLLRRALSENVKRQDPPAPSSTDNAEGAPLQAGANSPEEQPTTEESATTEISEEIAYVELPKDEKPQDRMVSAYDPDVRTGFKNGQFHTGDKVQVIVSANSRMILEVEPVPGNEPDGVRLAQLVAAVATAHPEAEAVPTVGDAAYGYGPQRKAMEEQGRELISPVVEPANPTGLYTNDKFTYDKEADQMICPAGHRSFRKTYLAKYRGAQFIFHPEDCRTCPFRAECTTAQKTGRTVFLSDFHEEMQKAREFNQTEDGQKALRRRHEIEPVNNALKNHHGLGRARTRGRKRFRIEVKLAALVVNIKTIVTTCGEKIPRFIRHPSRRGVAVVCP